MDAITLLKKDHKTVADLFKRYDKLGDGTHTQKREIVDQIILELSIHASIEETAFYPIRSRAVSDDVEQDVLESLEEHHVVKWLLSELEGMDPSHERFDAKVTVLKENVEHHVEEEEGEWFPKLRKALDRKTLQELGEVLAKAKETAPTHPHPRAPDEGPGAAGRGRVRARCSTGSATSRRPGAAQRTKKADREEDDRQEAGRQAEVGREEADRQAEAGDQEAGSHARHRPPHADASLAGPVVGDGGVEPEHGRPRRPRRSSRVAAWVRLGPPQAGGRRRRSARSAAPRTRSDPCAAPAATGRTSGCRGTRHDRRPGRRTARGCRARAPYSGYCGPNPAERDALVRTVRAHAKRGSSRYAVACRSVRTSHSATTAIAATPPVPTTSHRGS